MGKNNTLYHFDENRIEGAGEGQCHQFDYDSLDGEVEEPTYDPDQVQQMAEALREMLTWLTMGDLNTATYGQTVLRKTIAMCWVLRPEVFNGLALSRIAKSKGINVNKQALSKQAIKFAEKFGVKGRGQRKKI
jgi:hypothetical protein